MIHRADHLNAVGFKPLFPRVDIIDGIQVHSEMIDSSQRFTWCLFCADIWNLEERDRRTVAQLEEDMEIGVRLSGRWQFGIPDRGGELAAHHLCPEFHRFARIGRIVSEMIDPERASRWAHKLPPFADWHLGIGH